MKSHLRKRNADSGECGLNYAHCCIRPNTMSDPTTASSPANAQTRYDVHRADLPLSCPLPSMALWNSHPRVYLPIEDEGGESQCPYCGAHFMLVDFVRAD